MTRTSKYRLPDGTVVAGTTPQAIVESMSSQKLHVPRERARYRQATARRIREQLNVTVDAATDETFVQSLLAHGLLKPT